MRKVILCSVIFIFILSVSYLFIGIVKKVQNHKLIAEKINRLPTFSFMTLSNEFFHSGDIKIGPVLIVHFHPDCEHCQYEISEILRSNIPMSFDKIILISGAHPDSIKRFLNQLNYSDYPSVIPLNDISNNFEEIFGSGIVPSSYIYNRKLNLIKVLLGEVKTEAILKYLQESE